MMMGNGMMNAGGGMMGWGGMFFGPLMMIAFWGLVILAIVLLVKWAFANNDEGPRAVNAHEILKSRLAAGEIGEDEYHRLKHQIET